MWKFLFSSAIIVNLKEQSQNQQSADHIALTDLSKQYQRQQAAVPRNSCAQRTTDVGSNLT